MKKLNFLMKTFLEFSAKRIHQKAKLYKKANEGEPFPYRKVQKKNELIFFIKEELFYEAF